MATSPLSTVSTDALDMPGLSVVTSPFNANDPRAGTIYDDQVLAAAQPVWFHPFRDNTHLMITRRTWSGATPVGGTPQIYGSYTESTVPNWYQVDGATGRLSTMPNDLSLRTTGTTSDVVVAADSRPADLLWLMHSVTLDGQPASIVQMYHIDANNAVTLVGEETLPTAQGIVFDKGTRYFQTMLHAYGTDANGTLYRIRKLWNRIGFNQPRPAVTTGGPLDGGTWEYYTGSSWSADPTELAPIQDGLTSVGPVSFGEFRSVSYMSTVTANGNDRMGTFWTQSRGRPWQPVGNSISLGSTADGSYVGGGVELQAQLQASTAAVPAGANAGIVYFATRKTTTSGQNSLSVSWGVQPVTLVG